MSRFTDRLEESWLGTESIVESLRSALKHANNVESMVVLDHIERAASLARQINQLIEFSKADDEERKK